MLLAGCDVPFFPGEADVQRPPGLETLGIRVTREGSRPFVYTNKVAAYYYDEAAGPQTSGWQGFNVRGFVFVDGWMWTTDGDNLGPTSLEEATVFPDHVERTYEGGLAETVTLIDSLNVLLVEPDTGTSLDFSPLVADAHELGYLDVRTRPEALLIARKNHVERRSPEDHPVWLVVRSPGATSRVNVQTVAEGGVEGTLFSPGTLALQAGAPVAFAVADTPDEAMALAQRVLSDPGAFTAARAERMQALLDGDYVTTQDRRFDRAWAWNRLSMDALVMDQRGKGILAGLPWFNNYWGRDTFISLPGALLATGQFEAARDILRSFAAFQNTDSSSADFGRLPNTVSLDAVSYNTADGTPWFVIQAEAYVRHAGDTSFVEEMWPVVRRATDGSLRRTDADGFLLHGDQETWMDASAGPGQEWSPRGNSAVEVQGLWYQQLLAAATLAEQAGDDHEAGVYRRRAARLKDAFGKAYVDPGGRDLVDHLNADGTANTQMRPNQLFALRSFDLGDSLEQRITRRVASALAYPYGVASLAQTDPGFHPYHEAPQFYPKDAAYHNGIVWTWLSGPLVSLMVAEGAAEKAYEQIQHLDHLSLERGAVGTIAENVDAIPRAGRDEPDLSGTVSQAWSLAEYLRNVQQDFAGVRYEAFDHVVLQPRLPASWGRTTVRFRAGDGHVTASIRQRAGRLDVTLQGEGALPPALHVQVRALGLVKEVTMQPDAPVDVRIARGGVRVNDERAEPDGHYQEPDATLWQGFEWQQPVLLPGLAALQGPGWPLLDRSVVKGTSDDAVPDLDVYAPMHDDAGPNGRYTYPTSAPFKPGILDATRLTISESEDAYYFRLTFRDLIQPGWNPQYGFQLTFAAIAFDARPGGRREVGRNAHYTLPDGEAYDYVVYVGGGLRVEDGEGKVLAEYRPAPEDVADPLGSVDDATVRFRLPKTVLPHLPRGTKVTMIVGAQDDHGGAGIGDFRQVEAVAGEWTGGGKTDPGAPNVYDVVRGVVGSTSDAHN